MNIRTILSGKFFTALCIGIFFVGTAFITGCKKSDSVTDAGQSTTASDDAADAVDAVSDVLASNNGGVMDQVNDVLEISAGVGIGAGESLSKGYADSVFVAKQYDSTTATWTMSLYRQKSILPLYYGVWSRTYSLQFRANGRPQKFRAPAGGSIADSIIHKTISTGCTGYFWTPRLVHHLVSLSGNWTASNTNTDTVTINGSYSWSGIDTIKVTARAGRVINRTISLTFTNIRGPRGLRRDRSAATSGTITGTYSATVTVPGKAPYTVTKTFTIILGGGNAAITIDGTKYTADLATGDH